ncbi:MAG: PAS domain S-box protein, partial [bacterium]
MPSSLPSTSVKRASAWKQAGLFAIFGLLYIAACDMVIIQVYGYQIRWIFDLLIALIVVLSTLIIYRLVTSSLFDADNNMKELKYARFLLQSLLDSAPDYIYFKDTEGRFILVNDALVKFLQQPSAEEMIGKTDADIGQVEFIQVYYADEEQVMRTGQSMVNKEELQQLTNGDSAWISTTKMPLYDEQGKIVGTFGISRDITDIKMALEHQRELATSMNVVLEMTDALLYIDDYDELLRRAVELPRERLGIERCSINLQADETHMQGTYGTDVKGNTTDERNVFYEMFEHDWQLREYMERTGERWHCELKNLVDVVDGEVISIFDGEGVLTPIMMHGERYGVFFNDNAITRKPIDPQRQEILAVYCTLLGNILHRKKVELAFAQERSLLKALMTSAPDHIYFKDRESHFIRVSKTMMQAFDVDSMELVIGKTDSDFFFIEHAYKALSDEKQIIATGIPLENIEEKETWTGHEDSWVSTSKMPLYDETGNIIGTFGISRDITERKHAEDNLRALAEGMKKVLKMTDELLSCTTVDEVLRRAVELPRERLGIERTGLFFLSEDGNKIEGTFGTDSTGNTTDERRILSNINPASAAAIKAIKDGDNRWFSIADTDLTECKEGLFRTIRSGWKVITPVVSSSNRRAIMFNDNALTGGPIYAIQQDLLAVFCNGLGNIIDRQQAILAQLELARGMESVLKMTDELLSCPTMEKLLQRAVELPREYLGLERTGLFFISDDFKQMHGSYGTDINGNTTVEGTAHYGTSPWLQNAINEAGDKDIHWVVAEDDKLSEWKDGETIIVAHGWKIVTPMVSASGHITVMFNDNGRFGGKIDPIKQDLLAVYCSELGNNIDRKQIEEELRKSEAKARRITDNMLDVITQLDNDNRIVYISPSAISVLGYRIADMLGHSAIDIIHPDDVDQVRAAIVEMRVKGMVRIEHRVRHRRGNYLWMESVAKPLYN